MENSEDRLFEVLQGVHDFYGKDMSEFAGQVWIQACKTFTVDQVSKAISAHLMDPEKGQFMPKPADIVRQLQGTQTDRALVAWGKVFDAMQRVGAYADVCFDDGLIHCAIEDIGGWVRICRMDFEELPHTQRRFCDSYRAYTRRGETQFPAKLLGESSITNQAIGVRSSPVLIGNRTHAMHVLASGGKAKASAPLGLSGLLPMFGEKDNG